MYWQAAIDGLRQQVVDSMYLLSPDSDRVTPNPNPVVQMSSQ
jgi:hypothetical protein